MMIRDESSSQNKIFEPERLESKQGKVKLQSRLPSQATSGLKPQAKRLISNFHSPQAT